MVMALQTLEILVLVSVESSLNSTRDSNFTVQVRARATSRVCGCESRQHQIVVKSYPNCDSSASQVCKFKFEV